MVTNSSIRGTFLVVFVAGAVVWGCTSIGADVISSAPQTVGPTSAATSQQSSLAPSSTSTISNVQVTLIPASMTNPFRYVVGKLMASGPACPVRMVESESALWTAALEQKVAAFTGSGLAATDPPAWVGDMLSAEAGFGAGEVFAGSTDADVAWLLKTATDHESVQVPVGRPFVIQMERHDLDGRQVWILTHTFAAFDGC